MLLVIKAQLAVFPKKSLGHLVPDTRFLYILVRSY